MLSYSKVCVCAFVQLQLEEEEKLAKQQQDTLEVHYKKFKMIDAIMGDKTALRLARKYNLNIAEE